MEGSAKGLVCDICAEPRRLVNACCDIWQIRVRNLTYLQPFSPILVFAHTEVSCRLRGDVQRAVQCPSLTSVFIAAYNRRVEFFSHAEVSLQLNDRLCIPQTWPTVYFLVQRRKRLHSGMPIWKPNCTTYSTCPSGSELLNEKAQNDTPLPFSSGCARSRYVHVLAR